MVRKFLVKQRTLLIFVQIVPSARNNIVVEDMLRAACTALGSSIALAISPIQVRDFEDLAIIGTTSQAWWIGRAIEACRRSRYSLKSFSESRNLTFACPLAQSHV